MTRLRIVAIVAAIVAVPLAAAANLHLTTAPSAPPCFAYANGAYRITDNSAANVIVRIDNAAARPTLRLQVVNDPAIADFVVVDEQDHADACITTGSTKTVRIDPAAAVPDMTVALARETDTADSAAIKIYVNSATYSDQDAAALYAAIWQSSRRTASAPKLATAR